MNIESLLADIYHDHESDQVRDDSLLTGRMNSCNLAGAA